MFKELDEAQQLIQEFLNSPAAAGNEAVGVLKAVYQKIEDYKRRKRQQQQNA